MAGIAAQMKDLKRRGLQRILQGMNLAEQTVDEAHAQAYHNFDTLGNFLAHFKQSLQSATNSLEKVTKQQSNVASNVHAYIHSELSGDTDAPTGELLDFFATQDDEASTHAVMLQEVTERFYYACNDITNTVLQNMLHSLNELIIQPIVRDEELNVTTKELLDERKKLNLDYDAYKRATPGDQQDKYEAKLRAAKDKFEACSKRVTDHLALRNYNRSKILVHSVLSLIQQYQLFFVASSSVFQEVTGVLNPLLVHYQMDERQFMDMAKRDTRPPRQPVKDGASVPSVAPSRPEPPHSPSHKAPPVVPPKPTHPVRHPSPPRSPPISSREIPINGTNTTNGNGVTQPSVNKNYGTNGVTPPKPKETPLVPDDLMGDHPAPKPTPTPTPTPAPQPTPAPTTTANIFDAWEGMGGHSEPFIDTSFVGDTPLAPNATSPIPPHTPLTPHPPHTTPSQPPPTNLFGDDPLFGGFDFGKPSTTPLQPQPAQPTYKPQPTNNNPNNFSMPQQPNFKQQPSSYPQQTPPQGRGGYNNMPPPQQQPSYKPMPGGFPQPGGPGGFGGPMPGGGFPQPGGPNPNFTQQPGGGFGVPPFGPSSFAGAGGPTGAGGPGPAGSSAPRPGPPYGSVFFPPPDSDGLDAATASKLRQWAEKGGKKANLRALLSTIHEVLWPDSGWEVKGLGELISPAQVKRVYRQATLIVHPDKVASCTEEQKIIAKRIFECLRESYDTFKNEPQ